MDHPFGAVNPPIVRSSTFSYPDGATGAARFAAAGLHAPGNPPGIYSRLGNPTVAALEAHVAALEGGEACVATSSGMAAVFSALMAHLRPGARIVADPCVYGCTHALLDKLARWGVEVVRCRTSDPQALAAAIGDRVDVVFLESPMNPTLRLADIAEAARRTHAAGGLLIVDNTFATPYAQRPLSLGADLVVHSLTKGINGHSDLLAGAVVGPAALLEPVWEWRKDAGGVLDADTAWLALRGARTLDVRLARCTSSALTLATDLASEGAQVSHPMLRSHPDHGLAQRQMPGGCAVLTVDLGSLQAAMAFHDSLQVFQRAVSLGGYESLASHPWSTTHAAMPEPQRIAAGITPGLVRLSVGIEPLADLRNDVMAAFRRGLQVPVAAP